MSSSRTISKGIRLKKEVAEYFNEKPLNRYIESMYEHILSGEIEEEESGISVHSKTIRGTHSEAENEKKGVIDSVHIQSEADKLIAEDARAFGLDPEDFKLKLIEAVDDGKLMYENGEFLGVGQVDTSRFMERCAELGMNPQDTINKITQRLG